VTETAYEYRATVVRWIDGDTVDLNVDLGFRLTMAGRFRLDGIDTPERGTNGYIQAKARAEVLAPPGTELLAFTSKADKYGRWLACLWPDVGPMINAQLVHEGLAKPYNGGAKDAN
jgi:micrococcal nuclease